MVRKGTRMLIEIGEPIVIKSDHGDMMISYDDNMKLTLIHL